MTNKLKTALALGLFLASAGMATANTLDEVKARGTLICGTNPATAGFSMPDNNGNWTGFVVDYCRAVAAAVLGDPAKVQFIPLESKDRFTALQAGEIDILAHNATWTSSRDTSLGILFAGVYFYDGQGFMVHQGGPTDAAGLDGASICVSQGTTSELNIADYFRTQGMTYEAVGFANEIDVLKAFEEGRCDVYSADTSSLSAARLQMANPDDNVVLPDVISKEPLGPVVRHGDDAWFNIAKWTLFALVSAEEFGITAANVDEMTQSDNPNIRRLLGAEGTFGKDLGLADAWVADAVKAVGNYGEMFERNIGTSSPLGINRGVNALWNVGGLQYAPPIR
jgi:general L-amino acid transport system substrate-binding protein